MGASDGAAELLRGGGDQPNRFLRLLRHPPRHAPAGLVQGLSQVVIYIYIYIYICIYNVMYIMFMHAGLKEGPSVQSISHLD